MVQSIAPTVDAYFAELEPERVEAMRRVREECRNRLIGWEERMQWGMPGYGPGGADALISFNSQKGHISVYIGMPTIETYKSIVKGASFGKGCVRCPKPDRIDINVLGKMLSASYRAKGGII